MRVGCVLRNENGKVLHAMSRTFSGCLAPIETEAFALREALRRLLRLRVNNVSIESDCKSLVDVFHALSTDISDLGCMLADIRRMSSFGENFSLCFVKRQDNGVAHFLARATHHHASPSSWLEAPTFIVDALVANGFPS